MANQVLYGFMNLKDLFAKRINEVGAEVVGRAIQSSVDEHNRQMDALLSLFAQKTTKFKTRYKTPTAARLQPLDESGRARPIKPAGFYDVEYPIQMAGAAWGQDYVTKAKMTVEEANEATLTLISADVRWIRDHILAALYTNVTWAFADPDKGSLTIKGLANADTDEYLIMSGADVGATDQHYLAQAAAIADGANPFPTIFDELSEHAENGGQVVTLIPSNLRATVEALTNYREFTDPNIIPASTAERLVGSLSAPVPGEVIGYVDKNWIAEWRALPDDYMISVTTAGEPVLAMREDEEAELKGFQKVGQRDDYPFFESQYMRRGGFGAWNRVGGTVYRIGNASYAIPTNYGSPMP